MKILLILILLQIPQFHRGFPITSLPSINEVLVAEVPVTLELKFECKVVELIHPDSTWTSLYQQPSIGPMWIYALKPH